MTPPRTDAGLALELAGVSHSFGGHPVLRDLDLKAPRGQVIALLGPSGAGKTTMLRILAGALPPDRGTAKVSGKVGLLYQNDALVPGLRVIHNVLMGALGRWSLLKSLVSLVWPRDVETAVAALRAVQLEDKLYAPIGALSGGQRQRVILARLLVQDPEIVLADEPAASLDPRLGRSVVELLIRLSRDRGKTLVVSLHDMDLAVSCDFDRVLALRDGTWFWEGTPGELDRQRVASIFASERVEE